ncbi:Cof-type HAD-IIB family hydrolase [Effusibacillus consociatus]|uniref:Cof-type HAD-IIB family hydrolase n=1 Tax=Effusibacillus consociatus TaxID=1117041 RepID=A0ABV9Q2K3_9BACL
MKRSLIAIDLDGTTLTNNKTIAAQTKEAIKRVKELGHEVVIATGRPPRSSVNYHRELGLTTPLINFNGGLVHDPSNPRSDVHFPLDREVAMEIVEECKRFDVENVMIEVKDSFYVEQVDDLIHFLGDGSPPKGVGPIESYLLEHPTSILIRTSKDNIEPLRETLNEGYKGLVAHRYWSAPYDVIEVVKADVSKATGLMIVASALGIDREHVIAFGDEENDIEMIRWAGLGIAMGNANPLLKKVADRITDTNENNGLSSVLEELFLKDA